MKNQIKDLEDKITKQENILEIEKQNGKKLEKELKKKNKSLLRDNNELLLKIESMKDSENSEIAFQSLKTQLSLLDLYREKLETYNV